MKIKTVEVTDGEGFKVINESDFNEEVHEIYSDAPVLDRDALKAEADELGIEYSKSIRTENLAKLIESKKAE